MPLQLLSRVRAGRVPWFWPGRIPFGMTTLVDGDPGVGKTTMLLDLIARATTGRPLPLAGRHEPLNALILTVENSASYALVPRLENAGADMERVAHLDTYTDEDGSEVLPSIPSDVAVIDRAIETHGARLVVIDPIANYLDDGVNDNNTHQVYRALSPLNALAERTGAAIIMARHLTKGGQGGKALYRGQGSMGYVAAARSAMVVAESPDTAGLLVVANYKANLAPPVPAISFGMVNCPNDAPRIEWGGACEYTADALLASFDQGERSAVDEARDFLLDMLRDGALPSREVWKHASGAGLSRNTVLRAKESLGVRARKAHARDGGWSWELQLVEESEGGAMPDSWDPSDSSDSSDSSREDVKSPKSPKGPKNTNKGEGDSSPHVVNMPVATETAYAECAVCGQRIFGIKDRPLLCSTHKAAGGAWRVAD